jgi:hypothetical protein
MWPGVVVEVQLFLVDSGSQTKNHPVKHRQLSVWSKKSQGKQRMVQQS